MKVQKSVSLTDIYLRKAIYKSFNGRCFYTGRKLTINNMEIDHIIPKSKGGKDVVSNYVLVCKYINVKKNNKILHNSNDFILNIVKDIYLNKTLRLYKQYKYNTEKHKIEKLIENKYSLNEDLEKQLVDIINKCIVLRIDNKYTIIELSKILELDRRHISDFEKGKFNIYLADNILGYFGVNLILWSELR
jgi:CRISPR/Cas system Type II protein with McrA/HNH and RuvC-like nuclease domain